MEQRIIAIDDLPAYIGVKDLMGVIPLSRAGIYNLINSNAFPVIRVGKRVIIPKEGIIKWLDNDTKKEAN